MLSHPKNICLLILLGLAQLSYAQGTISGKIVDQNQSPLSFANVLLLQVEDSTLVKGAISNEEGSYTIDFTTAGEFLVSISMIGYQTTYTAPFTLAQGESKMLELITVAEDVATLDAVEVKAKKPLFEQKIDRTVVNVQNSITAAGSSALDVLERSPGVIVNRQSSSLNMNGKEGVIIYINGRESRMPTDAALQMLEGMNASNIEKIELITTPPASFDAEGDAGIINIVLRKSIGDGLNGSYTFNLGYGKKEKAGASINFNYRKNKINLFGDYNFSFDHNPQLFTNYRLVDFDDTVNETDSKSTRDPTQTNHNARLGLDINLSKNTVMGILVSGYDNKWEMTAVNDVEYLENGQITETLVIDNDEINHWRNAAGNFNISHTFSQGQKLTFNTDYLFFHDWNPTNYTNNYFDAGGMFTSSNQLRSGKETPINIAVATLDWTSKIGEKVNVETGIKGTLSRFTNDVYVDYLVNGIWEADPELTNDYKLEEQIGAAYASISFDIWEGTGVKAGLRYEHTDSYLSTETEAGIVDRNYGNFFPSIFINHQLNENQGINLSFSRRIRRPTFNNLAPFVIFTDPSTFFAGNPALQPALTNQVKADYRIKTFMVSLQYSVDEDAIANFQPSVDPENNRQTVGAINMDRRTSYGLSMSFPIEVTKWWNMRLNATGYIQTNELDYEEESVELTQQALQLNGAQNFTFPKGISMEVTGFFCYSFLLGPYEK